MAAQHREIYLENVTAYEACYEIVEGVVLMASGNVKGCSSHSD